MTVILDPGNDANSYSDGLSRLWKATAGLWKTAANDPGNAGNSYSDALARLWSATAGLWKTAANDPGNAANSYSDAVARLWSATAGLWKTAYNNEVTSYNNEVTLYNNEVTAYNNLLNGLVDTLTTVAVGSGLTTLTIPKTGHYAIGIRVSATRTTQNNNNASMDIVLGGTAGLSESYHVFMSTGDNGAAEAFGPVGYGFVTHGLFTAGQTITITTSNFGIATGGVWSGSINAHWVPTTANPS